MISGSTPVVGCR